MDTTSKTTADIIVEICCGNKDAEGFSHAFLLFCHALDDLIDQDKPIDREAIIETNINFLMVLAFNPFFQVHKAALMPLVSQAFLSWADSMDWAESGDLEKEDDSHVLKGGYHSVFFHLAMICGGWQHGRAISRKYRKYDHEKEN